LDILNVKGLTVRPFGLSSDIFWSMNSGETYAISSELASELERKFFWWEPVSTRPRSADLASLTETDKELLRAARDRVEEIPDVPIQYGSLAVPVGRNKG
jgi:hypothetical protein